MVLPSVISRSALERRRRGRGNYYARLQGAVRHTNPLPSLPLIGAQHSLLLLAEGLPVDLSQFLLDSAQEGEFWLVSKFCL